MYKKYLENAQGSYEKASSLEGYAKTVLSEDIRKYRDTTERLRTDIGPKINNIYKINEKDRQAKHVISLSFMQKIGAIKDERRESLNKVIKTAEEAKNSMPKATPEQIAEYRDRVNDLKTDLLFTIKFDDKQTLIREFIQNIDNPDLAAELRREFGNITKDAFISIEGDDRAKATILFKKYYNELKDGINFYPEDVKETIKLARSAESILDEDKVFNQVYTDTYVSQLLSKEQLAYVENPDEYFQKNYPALMEINIGSKIDSVIEDDILKPETEETVRAAAVGSLLG